MSEHISAAAPRWTLLTNHGRVLGCIAHEPSIRLADLADLVGIRERAVHRIVHDLIDAGYVECEKVGRRNAYRVVHGRPARDALDAPDRITGLVVSPESSTPLARSGRAR